MTTANLLARVRTILDEASASFWTDAEIYSALTDGEYEIISLALSLLKGKNSVPEILRTITDTHTDSVLVGNTDSLPADFLIELDVKYGATAGTMFPAYKRDLIKNFHTKDNTYLGGTQFYKIIDDEIIFEDNTTADHYWEMTYIKKPVGIGAATQPSLPDFSHPALVEYAVSTMFIKDKRPQEAQIHYQKFLQMIQPYIGI